MIQSAVFKLTLWYLGIILILSVLFSMALYRESSIQLDEAADRQRTAIQRLPLVNVFEPRRNEFLRALDEQLAAHHRQLMLRLLVLNLATLVLGGGAAYLLARRTLRPIQDSMEAQGRFTADASHELRTPLTAMRAEIEVALRQKELPPLEAKELLTSNLEEIAKLEALSAGLLRLARFENRLDPAAISKVPVRELFEEVTKRYKSKFIERKLKTDIIVGAESIKGDRASLIELIAVLVDNAIKYSPPASTITLQSGVSGHSVKITVADQGSGIAATDLPHIFERFYRADRSRTKNQEAGYGLGLSLAKRIVEVHHGSIAVESVVDHGATFRIKLPMEYVPKKTLL